MSRILDYSSAGDSRLPRVKANRIPKPPGSPGSGEPRSTVKSADRVLTLFELLGRWRREMSHAEIAEVLMIPKSSLSQLLKNLVDRGWLSYSPATKGYYLGDAIRNLARGVTQVTDLIGLAQPVLVELTAATNETSSLNVIRGNMTEVAATVLGSEKLTAIMRLGDRSPLYRTSSGKVLLANMPQDMQEDYLSKVEFVPATPRTIRSVEELRIQIEVIKREGIAYAFEEQTPGIVGTARPIVGPAQEVVGSISIVTPAVRYDNATRIRISEALRLAVAKLGQQLSLLAPAPDAPVEVAGPIPLRSNKPETSGAVTEPRIAEPLEAAGPSNPARGN